MHAEMEEQGSNLINERRCSADHSAALAAKLLEGWALLQEHCPQCLTPLVRNRQRKMYCVACAQWIVSQPEAAERLARERVEKGNSGEPALPALPLPEPPSVPTSSSHNIRESGRQEQVIDAAEPIPRPIGPVESLALVQDRQQPSSSTTLVIPKLDYHGKTLEQVVPNISLILVHKLEEIGNALLESQDVNDVRLLMNALRDCLQAVEALRGVQGV